MNINFRIIANKKVKITDDEYNVYQTICSSYEEFGGDSLFHDLFDVNEEGIIVMVKPPTKRKIPMEAFLFVLSIQQQQVLRKLEDVVIVFLDEMRAKYDRPST